MPITMRQVGPCFAAGTGHHGGGSVQADRAGSNQKTLPGSRNDNGTGRSTLGTWRIKSSRLDRFSGERQLDGPRFARGVFDFQHSRTAGLGRTQPAQDRKRGQHAGSKGQHGHRIIASRDFLGRGQQFRGRALADLEHLGPDEVGMGLGRAVM